MGPWPWKPAAASPGRGAVLSVRQLKSAERGAENQLALSLAMHSRQPDPTEEFDLQADIFGLPQGAERRRSQRDALTLPVELCFNTEALAGSSADVSETGLLFLTDAPVEVVVRIETEAGPVEHRGRLVRGQQLGVTITALAIAFEPDSERRGP